MLMAKKGMTDLIFFDTDCLASFLCVGVENYLVQLYPDRLVLPQKVYDEIERVTFLKIAIDRLITNGRFVVNRMVFESPEGELYTKLTSNPDPGYKVIGSGEAAAISLAKYNDGILGSNNMNDILPYIHSYKLKHTTTADILIDAFYKDLITEGKGNVIWKNMVNRNRKLPETTFSDYLKRKSK